MEPRNGIMHYKLLVFILRARLWSGKLYSIYRLICHISLGGPNVGTRGKHGKLRDRLSRNSPWREVALL